MALNNFLGLTGPQGPQGPAGPQGIQGPQGTAGVNGTNGTSAFVYIAYADDALGNGFTNTFDANKTHIAIRSSATAISNPTQATFTGLWKKYEGPQGPPGTGGTGTGLVKWEEAGSLVGERAIANFIAGGGIEIDLADDSTTGKVGITITNTAPAVNVLPPRGGVLVINTDNGTAVSTTAFSTLFSYTIPANTMDIGDIMIITLAGTGLNNTGSTSSFQWRVIQNAINTTSEANSHTVLAAGFHWEMTVTICATAANFQEFTIDLRTTQRATNPQITSWFQTIETAMDFTQNQAITFQVAPFVSNASLSITRQKAWVLHLPSGGSFGGVPAGGGAPSTSVTVSEAGTLIGTRSKLNLISGTNTDLVVEDDFGNDQINVTVNSTGSGGAANLAVRKNGVGIGSRPAINLIPGTNMDIVVADDAVNGEVDITLNASQGAGTRIENQDNVAGTRGGINFIAGNNVGITTADNAAGDQVDVTIDVTVPAGGDGTIDILANGSLAGTRPALNVVSGTGINITASDDTTNNRVNLTIINSGTSSGSGDSLINVKRDFGATGNGTTNDRAAIQAALEAVFTQNKAGLYFPDGDYFIGTFSTPHGIDTYSGGLFTPKSREHPKINSYSVSNHQIVFDRPHNLRTGIGVSLVGATPYNIVEGQVYPCRVISSTTIELYASKAEAYNTASTAGRVALGTRTVSAIDLNTDQITFSTAHGLLTGDRVRFQAGTTLPGGIDFNTIYCARVIDANTIQIHPPGGGAYPARNAEVNTNRVNITSAGSGTVSMYRVRGYLSHKAYNNGLVLEGSGRARLFKQQMSGTSSQFGDYYILHASNFSKLEVYNLEFHGRSYTNIFSNVDGDDGFRVENCYNVVIDSCRFQHFGDSGLRFGNDIQGDVAKSNCKQIWVRNCEFTDFGQISCTVSASGLHSTASEVVWESNIFSDSKLGVKFASRHSDTTDIKFLNNTIKDSPNAHNSNAALEIVNYQRVQVHGNTIKNIGNASAGIRGRAIFFYNNPAAGAVPNASQISLKDNFIINVQRGMHFENTTIGGNPVVYRDIEVKNNLFNGVAGNGTVGTGAVDFSNGEFARVQVEGNIFNNIGHTHGVRFGGSGNANTVDHAVSISGNIFQNLNDTTQSNCIRVDRLGSNTINGVNIQNNQSTTGAWFAICNNVDGLMLTGNRYRRSGGTFLAGSNQLNVVNTTNQAIV